MGFLNLWTRRESLRRWSETLWKKGDVFLSIFESEKENLVGYAIAVAVARVRHGEE